MQDQLYVRYNLKLCTVELGLFESEETDGKMELF